MVKFFAKERRTHWIWLMVAIALGVLAMIIAFRLDPAVQNWVHHYQWKNIIVLRRNVTRGTDWPAHIGAGLLLAGLAWRRGNAKWTRVFLAMVIAAALAGGAAHVLKISTGRVRPAVKVEKVWSGPTLRPDFQAFPSGHTAVTSGFFGVLFFVSWRIALLCLPIPLFVAFARVFLGAHYLSDVVGAALLGILVAYVVARLMLPEIRDSKSETSS